MRHSKYNAVKTVVNGVSFDSKAEAMRYQELLLLEKAGAISRLELQPEFVLAPAVVLDGRKRPARVMRADFRYLDEATGQFVTEDVKGMRLPVYILKRHLVKHLHGVEIVEIRR